MTELQVIGNISIVAGIGRIELIRAPGEGPVVPGTIYIDPDATANVSGFASSPGGGTLALHEEINDGVRSPDVPTGSPDLTGDSVYTTTTGSMDVFFDESAMPSAAIVSRIKLWAYVYTDGAALTMSVRNSAGTDLGSQIINTNFGWAWASVEVTGLSMSKSDIASFYAKFVSTNYTYITAAYAEIDYA